MRASSAPAEEAIATAEAEEMTAETVGVVANTADVTAETMEAMTKTADTAAEPVGLTTEADEAQDDAILDMIALEMAADDPSNFDDVADMASAEVAVAEFAPADSVIAAPEPEPEPMAAAAEPPAVEPSLQPAFEAPEEPSLGSSLISRGILNRPQTAADPLAPIRRMSQAEKIAFFS